MQVTIKDVLKQDRLCMKFQRHRLCAKSVFQTPPPISAVNFSDNISLPQVMVKMRETDPDTTVKLSKLLPSTINSCTVLENVSASTSSEYPNMVGGNL